MADIFGDGFDNYLVGINTERNFIFGYGGNDTLIGGNYQDPTSTTQGIGSDYLLGGDGDDLIYGLGGADYLRGDAGNDTLVGGDGDDYMRGGSGIDEFDGGNGFDRVSLFHRDATEAVYVNLAKQVVLNDGFGNVEYLHSVEGAGQGTIFADKFIGSKGDNLILAGLSDKVAMLDGDDHLQLMGATAYADGGAGTDLLFLTGSLLVADMDGDGLADIIAAAHGVHVDLQAEKIIDDGFGNSGVAKNFENLTGAELHDELFGDTGDNEITGNGGHDYLVGRDGDDTLDGGDGSDKMIGGDGNDVLIGGARGDAMLGGNGKDLFVYNDAGDSEVADRDEIYSFEHGIDAIDLSGLADEVLGGGPLIAAAGGFTGVAGEVAIDHVGPNAFELAVDLDGDKAADFMVNIDAVVAPDFTDIIV